MKKRHIMSLQFNMIVNTIRGFVNVAFPLITFPYISRVLGAENLGRYNFSLSIINYFILLAGLGIAQYAIREGARIRDDGEKARKFVGEIFSIGVLATSFSYLLFILIIITIPKLYPYTPLLLVLSLIIIVQPIGLEWIYSIYEDYLYISIRSFVFQLLTVVLIFVFVRDTHDLLRYVCITAMVKVLSNIVNYFNAIRYCDVKFSFSINLRKHVKPIILLFATAVAVTIYVSSDITILGFYCDDRIVGYYSVSVKIYTVLKTIFGTIITTAIAKIAAFLDDDSCISMDTASDVYRILITSLTPAIIVIVLFRNAIIMAIAGEEYVQANHSLAVLGMSLLPCMLAAFYSQCIMVPHRQEKKVLIITIISAIVNVILNLILIPVGKEITAAVTTLIAETIVFVYCKVQTISYFSLPEMTGLYLKVLLGSIAMIMTIIILNNYVDRGVVQSFSLLLLSVIIYALVEFILHNEAVLFFMNRRQWSRKN